MNSKSNKLFQIDVEHEKTEPNVQCSIDHETYTLLIQEEQIRNELVSNINKILQCKISLKSFMATVEETLTDTINYSNTVKELTDIIKRR